MPSMDCLARSCVWRSRRWRRRGNIGGRDRWSENRRRRNPHPREHKKQHARGHKAAKRGAGAAKLSLDEAIGVPEKKEVDLLALNESLDRLATLDPQQGQIVELRFFGGLSIDETAEVLHISPATVKRDWVMAKAWLYQNLAS